MTTSYTAFSHPAANFAIGRAAVICRRLLETHGFNPPTYGVGDAAYDTTAWIDDLEDAGYLDDTESRIARQVAFTAMQHGARWKPRCIRRSLEAQALWEAEVVAAARRIRDLVRKQAPLFDDTKETPRQHKKADLSRNGQLFKQWLHEVTGVEPWQPSRVSKEEQERRTLELRNWALSQMGFGAPKKERSKPLAWADVAEQLKQDPDTEEAQERAKRNRAYWAAKDAAARKADRLAKASRQRSLAM